MYVCVCLSVCSCMRLGRLPKPAVRVDFCRSPNQEFISRPHSSFPHYLALSFNAGTAQSVMQKQQQQIKCAAEASSVELEHYFFFFYFFFVFHPYWVSFKKKIKKKKREEFWRGHARKYACVCVHNHLCMCVWESIKHTYLDFWCNML